MALSTQLQRTPPVTGIPKRTVPLTPAQLAARRRKTVSIIPGSGVSHVPGFAPYQPGSPPPGTYDPTLDANLGAASRGYNDLESTTRLVTDPRAAQEYQFGVDGTNQQRDWSLADNLKARERTNQDYGTATAGLQRRYTNLGNSQAEQAQQAGAVGGGALADALLKRTANQGVEQAGLNTTRDRTLADLLQSGGTDGSRTGGGRINQAAQTQIDRYGTDYTRGVDDRHVALGVAGRELIQFGKDTTAAKGYSATGSGLWQAPPKPGNEFTSPGGTSYRVLKSSKGNKFMLPNGTIVSTRPA